jgi:hypothetical protein
MFLYRLSFDLFSFGRKRWAFFSGDFKDRRAWQFLSFESEHLARSGGGRIPSHFEVSAFKTIYLVFIFRLFFWFFLIS